jgi:hypothetical protein
MHWAAVTKVAEAYYHAYEWSGCEGSRWERLPEEAQLIWIRQADRWVDVLRIMGYELNRSAV